MGKLNVPTDEYAISPKRKFRDLSEEFIEENKDFIVKIPANELIYDRDNEKYYGEITDESIQDMALDMSTDGFKGVIMAYPVMVDGQRKYQIESGHRRYTAAKCAGITEIPTIITEPPKTDSERIIRLIKMNLHGRPDLSPTKKAKIIEALMSAHKEERIKAKKRHMEYFNITPNIAGFALGISTAMEEENAKNPEFEVIDVLHQGEWVSIVTRRK